MIGLRVWLYSRSEKSGVRRSDQSASSRDTCRINFMVTVKRS